MRYELENEHGHKISSHIDYPSALAAAEEWAGPDGVIGHDGDLSCGGDKTLIWANEASSIDDAGANAIGSIRENEFIGWSDGESHDGYRVDEYFDKSGRYLGPDEYGISPVFE